MADDILRDGSADYDALANEMKHLPEEELPESFHGDLMKKVSAAPRRSFDYKKIDYKKYTLLAAGLALTLMVLSVISAALDSIPRGSAGDQVMPAAMMMMDETRSLAAGSRAAAPEAADAPVSVVPSGASAEKNMRRSNIRIQCDDLSMALNIINGLPGYSTESSVRYYESGIDAYGRAEITRRTDEYTYEHAMNVLRSLGTVESETESQVSYTSEHYEQSIYLNNVRAEIERLSILLEKSESLDNVIFIESRISDLMWRMDSYRGRLNEIEGMTQSFYINITIRADAPYEPEIEKAPFAERLSEAFTWSVDAARSIMEGSAIFISRVAVPAIVFGALAAICVLIYKKVGRNKK